MKSIAVISGKGGTGKTMVTAALADINERKQTLADCDVDAANLELLFETEQVAFSPFRGMETAVLDREACISCGRCAELCRFQAISMGENGPVIETMRCEGCGVCVRFCPSEALRMESGVNGELFRSRTERGCLSHARLSPGSGNSGLLVHEVKGAAKEMTDGAKLLVVDGPPGTGCPLISTVSGTDAVIMVTEPSVSAIHDLERLVKVCRRFGPRMMIIINRYDLQKELTQDILSYCRKEGVSVIGFIPFDQEVVRSVRSGIPVTRIDCEASKAFLPIWDNIISELNADG